MKTKIGYKISATKKAVNLTLTVPNDAASRTWIHDLVAIRIAKGGAFIGDVYRLPPGKRFSRKGTFEPLHETFAEVSENTRA